MYSGLLCFSSIIPWSYKIFILVKLWLYSHKFTNITEASHYTMRTGPDTCQRVVLTWWHPAMSRGMTPLLYVMDVDRNKSKNRLLPYIFCAHTLAWVCMVQHRWPLQSLWRLRPSSSWTCQTSQSVTRREVPSSSSLSSSLLSHCSQALQDEIICRHLLDNHCNCCIHFRELY